MVLRIFFDISFLWFLLNFLKFKIHFLAQLCNQKLLRYKIAYNAKYRDETIKPSHITQKVKYPWCLPIVGLLDIVLCDLYHHDYSIFPVIILELLRVYLRIPLLFNLTFWIFHLFKEQVFTFLFVWDLGSIITSLEVLLNVVYIFSELLIQE